MLTDSIETVKTATKIIRVRFLVFKAISTCVVSKLAVIIVLLQIRCASGDRLETESVDGESSVTIALLPRTRPGSLKSLRMSESCC